MTSVGVIDAGLGNVASVVNMCRKLGFATVPVLDPVEAGQFTHLILPGVGAFDTGMSGLASSGWDRYLTQPRDQEVLGICLGMQLLAIGSEEGKSKGLGRVDAHFSRFDSSRVTVPHMGWNSVQVSQGGSDYFPDGASSRFYFTHSYFAVCADPTAILATAWHGGEFVAAFRGDRATGVQFHPEKSHKFGMRFLSAYLGDSCSDTE